jgi:hypothetical protein
MLRHNKDPENYSQRMIYNNYRAINFIDTHKHDDLTPELILEESLFRGYFFECRLSKYKKILR